MTTTANVPATSTPMPEVATPKTIILGKFTGAFSAFQLSAWYEFKRAGVPANIAHLMCDDYASDIGNALRNGDDFGTKVSKAKKDGESTLRISGKGNTTMSNTMAFLRVCQQMYGMMKEGLLTECKVWEVCELSGDIQDYINRKTAQAKTLLFVEK